jgi:hypothetical protein
VTGRSRHTCGIGPIHSEKLWSLSKTLQKLSLGEDDAAAIPFDSHEMDWFETERQLRGEKRPYELGFHSPGTKP